MNDLGAATSSEGSDLERGNPLVNGLNHTFRALRHRNFRLFFVGQFISLTGTWMQTVAQSWLVYRLTGSVALLGAIGFASQIPVFLLSPIGGAVADRFNRHRILIATQSTAMTLAFILSALTLLGYVQVWHLFVISIGFGLTNAFDIPCRQAFAVDMVGKDDLLNAIALNSSMFNGARIVGPAIAGLLVATIGEGWCFFANGASYIAVLAGLLMMRISPVIRPRKSGTIENIREGFAFVLRNRPIRALLLLLGLVSLMGMPYAVLMPIFADKYLGGGSDTLGFLMGASGTGALVAALILASRKAVFGLGKWIAASSALFGLAIIGFGFSTSFWLSLGLLLIAGFAMMTQMSASNTLVQAMVPDDLRGRVMSVYSMMFMGMAPIGALLAGAAANFIGPPATVAIGGMACILGSIVFSSRLSGLSAEGRQMILSLQMSPGEPASKASFQIPPSMAGRENEEPDTTKPGRTS